MHGARLPGGRRVYQPPSYSVQGSLRGSSAGIPRVSRCPFLLPVLCPSKAKLAVLVKLGKAHVAYQLVQHWEVSVCFCTSGEVLFPTRKGSPSFLLCLPPPKTSHCWGKTRLFVPGLLAAIPGAVLRVGGEMVSPLCSLSTKHCRAFSQREMGR